MNAGTALTAFMVAVTGAILIISGIRDTHPAVTFQSLLQGKLPTKGQAPTASATASGVPAAPRAQPPRSGGGPIRRL